jgi:hypothetical protein
MYALGRFLDVHRGRIAKVSGLNESLHICGTLGKSLCLKDWNLEEHCYISFEAYE